MYTLCHPAKWQGHHFLAWSLLSKSLISYSYFIMGVKGKFRCCQKSSILWWNRGIKNDLHKISDLTPVRSTSSKLLFRMEDCCINSEKRCQSWYGFSANDWEWGRLLQRILDATIFLVARNLAFWGWIYV